MVSFVSFFALSITPDKVFAGVFSFVTELFASEDEETSSPHNSQNMPILEAVTNIKPDPIDKRPDLVIDDKSVLEAYVGPMGTPIEIEEHEMVDRVIVYKVRKGDSISSIAKMFGVSANTIIWANGKTVKEGDDLTILPVSGIKYTVKKGDTVASIAKRFSANVDEIVQFNDLGDQLIVGTEIIIPDGEMAEPAKTSTKPGAKVPVKIPAGSAGSFIRPATGRMTQGLHGKFGTAVDIANKVGTPIYAAASGKVIVSKSSGYNGGYGSYIVIEHSNGTQSLYAHLSSNSVSVGTKVGQGDLIGLMGTTGKSTGSHLHFEILGGTRNWNPVVSK